MVVIQSDRLTKDYGSGRGVFDVTFHVDEGEVFGFLGPNGAGKSTTIRHLMGFSKPQSGSVQLFGKNSFEQYSEVLTKVGYIPGEIALPAGLTGWEFLRMMQGMQKCHNEERLQMLLKLFELDPSGETKRMSLGVKRKLAIVAAFMSDPEVLILDEPTSGLDPVMQDVFIDFVRSEKEHGKTILLSSHIFTEVDATCDRIAIIKDGRIVNDFVADDLRHATQKKYTVTFSDEAVKDRFLCDVERCEFLHILTQQASSVTFQTEDRDINQVIAKLSGYPVVNFSHEKQTLEDYFMKYYKEEKDFEGALSQ